VTTVSEVFQNLVFPEKTISDALGHIFMGAAQDQSNQLVRQYAVWYQAIGDIIQAPKAGSYSGVARASWPVAAALAPALFILRIALYHWNRLAGEEDSATRSAGDILTALVLAVLCGWFLDLVVQLGWWMTGAAIGEAGQMALGFIKSMSVEGLVQNAAAYTGGLAMLMGILAIAVELGALLAIAGMLVAFAAANAGLFLLAVLGPSVAVASALPQMRWLRSLWIKAVTVIALLPLVSGAVFKASTYMADMFTPGGILALFIRLMWLWGATGAMLSLAGILGKLTITTTTDAIGKAMQAVKGVVEIAGAAALGVASGGAGAAAAGVGAVGAGGGAVGAGAAEAAAGAGVGAGMEAVSAASPGAGAGSGLAQASSSLAAAQGLNRAGGWAQAFGLNRTASFAQTLSRGASLKARQDELSARMGNFEPKTKFNEVGFEAAPEVSRQILDSFGGSSGEFRNAFDALAPGLRARNIQPETFASQYPAEAGLLAKVYSRDRDLAKTSDPLSAAFFRSGLPRDFLDGKLGP
jgi:hypothetical protein